MTAPAISPHRHASECASLACKTELTRVECVPTSQPLSSQKISAGMGCNPVHRKLSSTGISAAAKALDAHLSAGAAAARPRGDQHHHEAAPAEHPV
jgi:hypothetical protein